MALSDTPKKWKMKKTLWTHTNNHLSLHTSKQSLEAPLYSLYFYVLLHLRVSFEFSHMLINNMFWLSGVSFTEWLIEVISHRSNFISFIFFIWINVISQAKILYYGFKSKLSWKYFELQNFQWKYRCPSMRKVLVDLWSLYNLLREVPLFLCLLPQSFFHSVEHED